MIYIKTSFKKSKTNCNSVTNGLVAFEEVDHLHHTILSLGLLSYKPLRNYCKFLDLSFSICKTG